MQSARRYGDVFGSIPIFGMIHLAGESPVERALEEIAIFEDEGVNGAIVENYHGSIDDVIATLGEMEKRKPRLSIGINILPNEFELSLSLADKYGADFIQLDHVAGKYHEGTLDLNLYDAARKQHPNVLVLGGVWPKYYHPMSGSNLRKDLGEGVQRADAIVVTGAGTGQETPIDKIRRFRDVIGDHPLVIGAGLTPQNAYEPLCISDGAIVGTSFKVNNDTYNPVDRQRVREFMDVVKEAREYKKRI